MPHFRDNTNIFWNLIYYNFMCLTHFKSAGSKFFRPSPSPSSPSPSNKAGWAFTVNCSGINIPDHVLTFSLEIIDVINLQLQLPDSYVNNLLSFFYTVCSKLPDSVHPQIPKSSHLPHSASQNRSHHAHPQNYQFQTKHFVQDPGAPEFLVMPLIWSWIFLEVQVK